MKNKTQKYPTDGRTPHFVSGFSKFHLLIALTSRAGRNLWRDAREARRDDETAIPQTRRRHKSFLDNLLCQRRATKLSACSFKRPLQATHHRAKCFTLRDFALAGS